jgi:sulfite reductase (NADPH) flavoprotein alpha-component
MPVAAPCLPENAPFTAEQRAWLNGFFAGLYSRQEVAAGTPAQPAAMAARAKTLLVVYGSQTGTCEELAKKFAKEAKKRGFAPTVRDMSEVALAALAQETTLLVITSTYGDGEPPDNAKALHAALGAAGAPQLGQLAFGVCALGDRNYVKFCQCGKDFDARLAALSARRLAPLTECEPGDTAKFRTWLDATLDALAAGSAAARPNTNRAAEPEEPEADEGYSRARPFSAPLLAVRRLSAPGSKKEVNHVEFSLANSGLTYEAGDALGLVPLNDPALADAVATALGCDGEEPVPTLAGELPLRTALVRNFDLGKPMPELLTAFGVAPADTLHHVIDVVAAAGAKRIAPGEFARHLRPLQPRLYSISSSPKAFPGQVHLTVGAVRYELHGRQRHGVASTFLADRALNLGSAGVYVHANKNFRPPADGETPLIMIGPGTGIAPFRAFLGERRAIGATGRNWLFFGDQSEAADFLYRDELLSLRDDGLLTRLDLAWSRDQADKIYVQHRMLENAAEFWSWLEAGAHLYVCGDASRMAKDVHAALRKVIETAGGRSPEAAEAYIDALVASRRYQRDVY